MIRAGHLEDELFCCLLLQAAMEVDVPPKTRSKTANRSFEMANCSECNIIEYNRIFNADHTASMATVTIDQERTWELLEELVSNVATRTYLEVLQPTWALLEELVAYLEVILYNLASRMYFEAVRRE